MKTKKFLTIVGLIALFVLTPVLVSASGLVSFNVQYPEGEDISNDLQVVYSAYGGGHETICAKTSQSLDCDIVGLSDKNGFDIQWEIDSNNGNGPEQVVILTTEKGSFLMVIDDGLVDIDQIEIVSTKEEISIIETTNIVIETEAPNPTSEPIETPIPEPTEDNKCGHFGPHLGTAVAGEEYACKGGN